MSLPSDFMFGVFALVRGNPAQRGNETMKRTKRVTSVARAAQIHCFIKSVRHLCKRYGLRLEASDSLSELAVFDDRDKRPAAYPIAAFARTFTPAELCAAMDARADRCWKFGKQQISAVRRLLEAGLSDGLPEHAIIGYAQRLVRVGRWKYAWQSGFSKERGPRSAASKA